MHVFECLSFLTPPACFLAFSLYLLYLFRYTAEKLALDELSRLLKQKPKKETRLNTLRQACKELQVSRFLLTQNVLCMHPKNSLHARM